MTRFLFAFVVALVASVPALAQDMPLSQILIDGEEWKKVETTDRPVKDTFKNRYAYSPDGKTEFRWHTTSEGFIEARQVGKMQQFAPYCPLRLKGNPPRITVTTVTGLTTDKDGRIYAATPIGVQVFDPTGRLCGVLSPAAPGTPMNMAFEGDTLTLWVGDTKYARKLRTQGVK